MIRVTVDLPRMPLTWIRHWSDSTRRRCAVNSARQRARSATHTAIPATNTIGTLLYRPYSGPLEAWTGLPTRIGAHNIAGFCESGVPVRVRIARANRRAVDQES